MQIRGALVALTIINRIQSECYPGDYSGTYLDCFEYDGIFTTTTPGLTEVF